MELGYKFTSKELDAETNLYYFGARYYDAVVSRWISTDKALARYLPCGDKNRDKELPGLGGVYNSVNLNVYQYAGFNPVKLIDPDGNAHIFSHWGNNYYMADTRFDNVLKAMYSFAIPVIGSLVYDSANNLVGRTDLKPDSTGKRVGVGMLESAGLMGNSKKLAGHLVNIGKKASVVALANNTADLLIAAVTGTNKVEYAIQELGLLNGYDKGFIKEMAPVLENEMRTLIKNGTVQILGEGKVMANKDVIDEVRSGIKFIYDNQWKKDGK